MTGWLRLWVAKGLASQDWLAKSMASQGSSELRLASQTMGSQKSS